jgi:hypothetical protein
MLLFIRTFVAQKPQRSQKMSEEKLEKRKNGGQPTTADAHDAAHSLPRDHFVVRRGKGRQFVWRFQKVFVSLSA